MKNHTEKGGDGKVGYSKNLAIARGEFDGDPDDYWDSFDCQIQAEDVLYLQKPESDSNDFIELVPF